MHLATRDLKLLTTVRRLKELPHHSTQEQVMQGLVESVLELLHFAKRATDL